MRLKELDIAGFAAHLANGVEVLGSVVAVSGERDSNGKVNEITFTLDVGTHWQFLASEVYQNTWNAERSADIFYRFTNAKTLAKQAIWIESHILEQVIPFLSANEHDP